MIRAASIPLRPPVVPADLVGWTTTFPMIAGAWREFRRALCDPYRPERHYMRGPGPKWRERHPSEANRSIPVGKALHQA
jgi:hypothetical protein